MESSHSYACGIELDGKFVVTGGFIRRDLASAKVIEYTEAGVATHLPSMKTGRRNHACSKFVKDDGDTVSCINYIILITSEIKQSES